MHCKFGSLDTFEVNIIQFLLFKSAYEFLLQGEALFQTHENLEHLAMMERVLGSRTLPGVTTAK